MFRKRKGKRKEEEDITFADRDKLMARLSSEVYVVRPEVHKYEHGQIPDFVSIGRELEDTARELRISGFPNYTIRHATLRKLKLRRDGYVHTMVRYGNVFHDGKMHRKRIEIVSKYPLKHLHQAFLHETITPPQDIQDKGKQLKYREKYLEKGMALPVHRGIPEWDYNVMTWNQLKDGKYKATGDPMAQWVEYEQVS